MKLTERIEAGLMAIERMITPATESLPIEPPRLGAVSPVRAMAATAAALPDGDIELLFVTNDDDAYRVYRISEVAGLDLMWRLCDAINEIDDRARRNS